MEFTLYDRQFRVKKLHVFGQLHLDRKIAPLIPPLAPLIVKMSEKDRKDPLSANIMSLAQLAGPFAEALASMKDEDAEQIFNLTLSSVEIQTDPAHNVWMPLWNVGARMAIETEFNDVAKLLPIVTRVVIHNLGNFMAALPTSHEEAIPVSSGASSPAAKTG